MLLALDLIKHVNLKNHDFKKAPTWLCEEYDIGLNLGFTDTNFAAGGESFAGAVIGVNFGFGFGGVSAVAADDVGTSLLTGLRIILVFTGLAETAEAAAGDVFTAEVAAAVGLAAAILVLMKDGLILALAVASGFEAVLAGVAAVLGVCFIAPIFISELFNKQL